MEIAGGHHEHQRTSAENIWTNWIHGKQSIIGWRLQEDTMDTSREQLDQLDQREAEHHWMDTSNREFFFQTFFFLLILFSNFFYLISDCRKTPWTYWINGKQNTIRWRLLDGHGQQRHLDKQDQRKAECKDISRVQHSRTNWINEKQHWMDYFPIVL